MTNNIKELIIKDLVGRLTHEETIVLHRWFEASEENIEIYIQVREVYALNNALVYRSNEKNKIYSKVTAKKSSKIRSLSIITSVAVAVAVVAVLITILLPKFNDMKAPIDPLLSEVQVIHSSDIVFTSGNLEYRIGSDVDIIKLDDAELKNNTIDNILEFKPIISEEGSRVVINKIKVPIQRTYKVVLPDGTRVILNAQTALTFPSKFTGDVREVTLHGEALFEVTPDPNKRFIVRTDSREVRVYGTVFNVNTYDDASVVSLISGSVVASNGIKERKLVPGEQAFVSSHSDIKVSSFNVDEVLSWEKQMFIFDDKPLSNIVVEMERWYGVKFKFNDDKLKNMNAYVRMERSTSLNELLGLISATNKLRFQIVGDEIVIYSN